MKSISKRKIVEFGFTGRFGLPYIKLDSGKILFLDDDEKLYLKETLDGGMDL